MARLRIQLSRSSPSDYFQDVRLPSTEELGQGQLWNRGQLLDTLSGRSGNAVCA